MKKIFSLGILIVFLSLYFGCSTISPRRSVDSEAGSISGSGSAGQVAFWTGANRISGDKKLYWDNTNKKLGIGLSTPKARLDVISPAYEAGIRWRLNGGWGVGAYTTLMSNNARGMLLLGNNNPAGSGKKSELQLVHAADGWQTSTINENYNLYPRHGNVGVSYLDPMYKLDVSGSSWSLDSGPWGLEMRGHYTGEEDAIYEVQKTSVMSI